MNISKLTLFLFFVGICSSTFAHTVFGSENNSFFQINQIVVEVDMNNQILLNEKQVELENLSPKIDSLFYKLNKEDQVNTTLTIKTFESTPKSLLNQIKREIKKTQISLADIQIRKQVSVKKVTDSMFVKYNRLVKGWKDQNAEERIFTKEDVLFTREVYKKMDFKQMIKAEKFPSFIPKIDELED